MDVIIVGQQLREDKTFETLFLVDLRKQQLMLWRYRQPDGIKPTICQAAQSWLLSSYGRAWESAGAARHTPPVLFVGADPKNFVHQLAAECAAPPNSRPMPPAFWLHTDDNCLDIQAAAAKLGKSFKELLELLGVSAKSTWINFGDDAQEDVRLVAEVALRYLGI